MADDMGFWDFVGNGFDRVNFGGNAFSNLGNIGGGLADDFGIDLGPLSVIDLGGNWQSNLNNVIHYAAKQGAKALGNYVSDVVNNSIDTSGIGGTDDVGWDVSGGGGSGWGGGGGGSSPSGGDSGGGDTGVSDFSDWNLSGSDVSFESTLPPIENATMSSSALEGVSELGSSGLGAETVGDAGSDLMGIVTEGAGEGIAAGIDAVSEALAVIL